MGDGDLGVVGMAAIRIRAIKRPVAVGVLVLWVGEAVGIQQICGNGNACLNNRR